jgi:hypothetical protein
MPRPADLKREEAKALGLKRYVSSARLCPQGHSEFYVISAGCCKCSAERLRKRKKQPRAKRPQVSAKVHMENIALAATRFNRPKFIHALTEYAHSAAARQRSAYLDRLTRQMLTKVPHVEE